jgi:hypothetical protein
MTISFEASSLIYIVYFALFVGAVFFVRGLYKKARGIFRRPELYNMSRESIKRQWMQIEELLERPDDTSWKLAVMEADKLLDHSLKSMAIPGMNMGERLRFIAHKYPKINNVWRAHKTRNDIAHQAAYRLSRGEAKSAIRDFKSALEEIGVL